MTTAKVYDPDLTGENFYHDKYGYCYYSIEPDKKPVIFNLYIEPEYRRKGHARKHLQFVINEIRKTGCEGEIEIEAAPRENSIDSERLVSFYKSMGLEILEGCQKHLIEVVGKRYENPDLLEVRS